MKHTYIIFTFFMWSNAADLSLDIAHLTKTLNQIEQFLFPLPKELYFVPIMPKFQLNTYILGKKYQDFLGAKITQLPTWVQKNDQILIANSNYILGKYAISQIRVFDQYKHGCKFPGSCDMQSLKNLLYGLRLLDNLFNLDLLQKAIINLLENQDNLFENVWLKYLHDNFGIHKVDWLDEIDLLKLIKGLKNGKLDTTKPPQADKYAQSIIFLEFSDTLNYDYYKVLMKIDPTLQESDAQDLGYFLINQKYISEDEYDIEYMFEQYSALYAYTTSPTIGYGFLMGVGTHAAGHEIGFIASKINNKAEYLFFDSMNQSFLDKSNYQQLFANFFALLSKSYAKPEKLILPIIYYYLFDLVHNLDGEKNSIAKAISLFKPAWKKAIIEALLQATQFLENHKDHKTSAYVHYKPYFCKLISDLKEKDNSIAELATFKQIFGCE